jgi:hypothetical protein
MCVFFQRFCADVVFSYYVFDHFSIFILSPGPPCGVFEDNRTKACAAYLNFLLAQMITKKITKTANVESHMKM